MPNSYIGDYVNRMDFSKIADKYGKRLYDLENSFIFDDDISSNDKEEIVGDKEEIVYYHILGINKYQLEVGKQYQMMSGFVRALYSFSCSFDMIFRYENSSLNVFIGIKAGHYWETINCLNAIWGPNITQMADSEVMKYNKKGELRGDVSEYSDDVESIIEKVINGACKDNFVFCVKAVYTNRNEIKKLRDEWLSNQEESQMVSQEQFSFVENNRNLSYSLKYLKPDRYSKISGQYVEKYNACLKDGMWEVKVEVGIPNNEDRHRDDSYDQFCRSIAGIIISSAFAESGMEPLHYITKKNDTRNYLSSKELGRLIAFPSKDILGFFVREKVDFDLVRDASESADFVIGNIFSNQVPSSKEYKISVNEFTRHCLVVGLTGSGKTNTTMNLAYNLIKRNKRIPIMVIEPAKSDYWKLYRYGIDQLNIFSVGGSNCNLNLNPFECPKGTNIQSHIDAVFAAFKASFVLYPPMPYVLENAIVEIYEDCGWIIEENRNVRGEATCFPTIENLYDKIPIIIERMGYVGEQRQAIMAGVHARVNSLRIGIKGKVLNVNKSTPDEILFGKPVIVELDEIGDDDAKAFLISLLLIKLSEYRKRQKDSDSLRHVLIIEEAHRLLKNVQGSSETGADPRANAVEYFCNLLAEMRSKGQGFIIVDQMPAKLAPDIIENTNTKIVHRLVAERERELVGGCMNMTDEQKGYIACLPQGVAAVYSEGDMRPILVKPQFIGTYIDKKKEEMNQDDIIDICNYKTDDRAVNQKRLSLLCSNCPKHSIGCHKIYASSKKIIKDNIKGDEKNLASVCDLVYKDLVEKKIIKGNSDKYLMFCVIDEIIKRKIFPITNEHRFVDAFVHYMNERVYQYNEV